MAEFQICPSSADDDGVFPSIMQLTALDRPIAASEAMLKKRIRNLESQVDYWRKESYRLGPSNCLRKLLSIDLLRAHILSFLNRRCRLDYLLLEVSLGPSFFILHNPKPNALGETKLVSSVNPLEADHKQSEHDEDRNRDMCFAITKNDSRTAFVVHQLRNSERNPRQARFFGGKRFDTRTSASCFFFGGR